MPFKYVDRAKEQASTTGTGTFTLSGAYSGMFVTFASVLTTNGDTTSYCAENEANNEWEAGILTRVSATAYSRSVQKGTNGASPVNFTAAPVVFSTVTAASLVPLEGPSFRAYRATNQTGIVNSTWTKVQLATESWDYGACFDSATNYRWTPNVAGIYLMQFGVRCDFASGGTVALSGLYKNGVNWAAGSDGTPSAGTFGNSTGGSLVEMNGTTDYLELYGFLNGTTGFFLGASSETFLSGSLVRRTG